VFGGFCLLLFFVAPSFPFGGVTVFWMPVFGVFAWSDCSEHGFCWFLFGEFDPGSGRTLAACLTHASRTERPFGVLEWRTGE
jgi:hypothetical protein